MRLSRRILRGIIFDGGRHVTVQQQRQRVLAWSVVVLAISGYLFASAARPQAQYANSTVGWNRCIAVTTSDTVDLAPFAQSQNLTGMVYVGGAGNVTAVNQDGSTYLLTAPPVGSVLPIGVRRINATGTSATVLVACYKI